jgi:hypothetical protein
MTLCIFRSGRSQIAIDCLARRTYTLPASGQAGEATIRVPYGAHPNLRECISSAGASLVMIPAQGDRDGWYGVVTGLDFDVSAVEVTAHQPWIILGKRNVSAGRRLVGHNCGDIWQAAVREALGGLGGYPLRYGPQTDTPPIIPYEFAGQDLMSVAVDLMAASGMELMHTTGIGGAPVLGWGAMHARSRLWPDLLVAGSGLQDEGFESTIADRVSRVNARDRDGRTYTAYQGIAAAQGWPAEMTVQSGNSLAELMAASEQELIRLLQPGVQISGGVPRIHPGTGTHLWDIRERDFVRVVFPRARFNGATATCRVLARTRSDDEALMGLTLQVMGDPATQMNIRRPYRGITGRPGRGSGRPWGGRRQFNDFGRRLFELESRRT